MASNPLCGALHDHISAMLDRPHQSAAGTEGVVDNQRNAVLLRQS